MQEIIVYRNPLEALMWESIMNGSFLIFMLPVIFAVVIVAWLDEPLNKRLGWNSRAKAYIQYGCIAVGILCGFAGVWNF